MTKCECGCGGEAREGRRFVCHHQRVGRHHSLEAKQKIKITLARPEVKAKQRAGLKIANARPEVKAKRSASAKVAWKRPEYKAKLRAINARPEVKAKRSVSAKAANARPEVRAKHKKNTTIAWKRPGVRAKRRATDAIPEVKARRRIAAKKKWQDPQYARAIIKGRHNRPTKPELEVSKLLKQLCPNEYKYNGNNAGMVINGRVPDFVNCNGQKKVILVNGIYWHLYRQQKENPLLTKRQVEQKEKKPYSKFGFDVCFVWEDELHKSIESTSQKISIFNTS